MRSPLRVLAVDDNEHSLYLLRLQLQAIGAEVREAGDGAAALEAARAFTPDVVISDLLMPVMDGFTLLRHLRADARLAPVPFIVHTATYTEPRDEKLARDLGADAFLVKPAEPAALADAIRRAVSSASARAPSVTTVADGVLRAYSEVLVAKLEDKAAALEKANRELTAAHARAQSLSQQLVRSREEESARIAREIHDELGQALTGLKLDVGWLERRLDRIADADGRAILRERLRSMSDAIDATVAATRRICAELRPAVLDDLGLVSAIEWQARRFEERTQVPVELRLPAAPLLLDEARAVALFRIFQELLTNVARHAHASRVDVELQASGGAARLLVADDGRGFATDNAVTSRTFGLDGIHERAAQCGGSVEVASGPGLGTRVTVILPLGEGARGEGTL